MPSPTGLTRRALLQIGGGAWASTLLSVPLSTLAHTASTHRAADSFITLTPELAATLEAVAARIIPTTSTPGAREAGAIWFIDAAVAGVLSESRDADQSSALPLLEAGAADLDERAQRLRSGSRFSNLPGDEQDSLLQSVENSDFFGVMRFLTLAGTFTMPAYRGNRDEVGWDMLGFERRHVWQKPFGHYDAEVHSS